MSQEVLAFESDLTREFISLLERGQRSPTLDTQLALCKALSVSLDEMAALVISEIKRQPTDASST
jgi:transcriptional regulator with XRE-family HTH domain